MGGALEFAPPVSPASRRRTGEAHAGFGSAKCSNEEAYLFQKLVRRLRVEQRRPLHAPLPCFFSGRVMETIGSGAVTAPFTAVKDSDVIIVIGANPTENHRSRPPTSSRRPSAARAHHHGPARHRDEALRHALLQFKNGGEFRSSMR